MNCCLVQVFKNLNLHKGGRTSSFRAGSLAVLDDFRTATVLQSAPGAIKILVRRANGALVAPKGMAIPEIHWRRCDGMVSGPARILDISVSEAGEGLLILEYCEQLLSVKATSLRSRQVLEGQYQ